MTWSSRAANGSRDDIFKYPPCQPMGRTVAKTSARADQWRKKYANGEFGQAGGECQLVKDGGWSWEAMRFVLEDSPPLSLLPPPPIFPPIDQKPKLQAGQPHAREAGSPGDGAEGRQVALGSSFANFSQPAPPSFLRIPLPPTPPLLSPTLTHPLTPGQQLCPSSFGPGTIHKKKRERERKARGGGNARPLAWMSLCARFSLSLSFPSLRSCFVSSIRVTGRKWRELKAKRGRRRGVECKREI